MERIDKRRLISASVDARCERFNIKLKLGVYLSLVVFLLILAISVFWKYPGEMLKAIVYYNLIFAVSYIPLILFSVFRLSGIMKGAEEYIYAEATLDEFHSSMGKFYFRVSFTDEIGKRYTANTDSFYSARASIASFDEWYGKKVMIAYDHDRGKVIVICKLNEYKKLLGGET